MSTPRRHHYVPKAYLAAWTNTGSADGRLHVLDKSTGRSWVTGPINAAVETDLYMIDLDEVAEDISATEIESQFAVVEGSAMPIIRGIIDDNTSPTSAELEELMAFLAVLTLRVPGRLQWIDDFMRQPIEAVYRRLEAEGKLPQPDDPELAAQMKEWFDSGLIEIKIKQNARLGMMVAGLETVMKQLVLRHWTVLRCEAGAGDLICTDHPVLLEWIRPVPDGSSPGFGLTNTAVFAPLSPNVALLGLWDAEPTVPLLNARQVAGWNSSLLGHVHRFVFSRGDFEAVHKSGVIDRRSDVLRRWTPAT